MFTSQVPSLDGVGQIFTAGVHIRYNKPWEERGYYALDKGTKVSSRPAYRHLSTPNGGPTGKPLLGSLRATIRSVVLNFPTFGCCLNCRSLAEDMGVVSSSRIRASDGSAMLKLRSPLSSSDFRPPSRKRDRERVSRICP